MNEHEMVINHETVAAAVREYLAKKGIEVKAFELAKRWDSSVHQNEVAIAQKFSIAAVATVVIP